MVVLLWNYGWRLYAFLFLFWLGLLDLYFGRVCLLFVVSYIVSYFVGCLVLILALPLFTFAGWV